MRRTDMKQRVKKRWEDHTITGIGRREARAAFYEDTSEKISLNGQWKFLYLEAPELSPEGFMNAGTDGWDEIDVPSVWQLRGYDAMHYTDVLYLFPIHPPYVPSQNPTGIYKKNVVLTKEWLANDTVLRFHGVDSAFDVWVNGEYVGYSKVSRLPSEFDITDYVSEGDNDITVRVYKWSDGTYLEDQDMWWLSGIYRDVELINEPKNAIMDCCVNGDLDASYRNGILSMELRTKKEECTGTWQLEKEGVRIAEGVFETKECHAHVKAFVENVQTWTAETPELYTVIVRVDGHEARVRTGFRKIEIKGRNFRVNNKVILLNGINHHDYNPKEGRVVSYEQMKSDVILMKKHNINAVRCSHYPANEYFYDLCDEYGLYVIDEADLECHGFEWVENYEWITDDPEWEASYVDRSVRMVKRDRNHPCVWMWEPILNETWYPAEFAKNVVDVLNEEYPYPYCYAGCDVTARGHEHFPIHFTHPVMGGGGAFNTETLNPDVCYFTREWGDNVDDWYSHNSPSRVNRVWGEVPMLIQAQGYANPDYKYTCYDVLYRTSRQHMGGCLWHSFDHQRGYHPDPFYGGIMDAFRQPKFSYYMFCSQRPAEENKELIADSGPMVYIANEMTPFSPKDVTVYSNCEEVRLTFCKNGKQHIYHKPIDKVGMPSPVIIFSDVFDFMYDKQLSRGRKQADSYLLAEGLIAGKVVATHKVMPARRPSKILLWADDEKVSMKANGSDIMTVIAAIADDNGNIKRLNNYEITFEIEGPGQLIADSKTFTNPAPVRWGTAPVLVRSSTVPGEIKVRASVIWQGKHTPVSAELIIPTYQAEHILLADKKELEQLNSVSGQKAMSTDFKGQNGNNLKRQQKVSRSKLKEVEKQQSDFE